MPKIYYNLDLVPDDLPTDEITVFLIGPSSRDYSQVTSYRAEFTRYLTQLEKATGQKFIIFNPEGPNWAPGKGDEFARWELKQLARSAVIVIGLNNEPDHLPGLTTRTEAGFLLASRRNLVLWRPEDSYKTSYIAGLFAEKFNYLSSATTSLEKAAHLVLQVWETQKSLIQVRTGRFNSTEIRPNGCDPFYLEQAIQQAEKETKGAIYLYLPLFDLYHYGAIVAKFGHYQPFIQTKKYNILYHWNGPSPSSVPEPGSSIAGAFGMFFSPDEKHCLMIYETKYGKSSWNFVGGAVDRGELDLEAFQREVKEEIGITLTLDPNETFIVSGYNQKNARCYGVWDENDPPVYMNDHFTVYLVHLPMDTEFKVNEQEVQQVKWFKVEDILENRILELNQFNRQMVQDYVKSGRKLHCSQSKETKIKFG